MRLLFTALLIVGLTGCRTPKLDSVQPERDYSYFYLLGFQNGTLDTPASRVPDIKDRFFHNASQSEAKDYHLGYEAGVAHANSFKEASFEELGRRERAISEMTIESMTEVLKYLDRLSTSKKPESGESRTGKIRQ